VTKDLHSADSIVTLFFSFRLYFHAQDRATLVKEGRTMGNSRSVLKQDTHHRVLLLSLVFSFLAAFSICLLQPHRIAAQDQQVQVVELKAKKYEYLPSPVHVKAGTKVQLKITAVDHDHGFKITTVPNGAEPGGRPGLILSSPQDCWQLKKGETTTIEFVAQTPGTYPFWCCHRCGLGHKDMKSELVVN
jgi:heme/copper-type cytochrome/quinol oxidase subunit 2